MSKKSKGKGVSLAVFQQQQQETAQKKQQEVLLLQQQQQKQKEQQQKQKKQQEKDKKQQQQQQQEKKKVSTNNTPTSTPTTAVTTTSSVFSSKVHFQPNKECQDIIKVLIEVFGEDRVNGHIDQPMLNYFASVLHAQNSPATQVPETEVSDLLSLFSLETGATKTQQESNELAKRIISELRSRSLLSEPIQVTDDKRIKLLDEAINLGRTFEVQMKQTEIMNSVAQQVSANYNESLDWEQKVVKERKEKKAKRDQKMRELKVREYQDFLQQRGLSSGKGIVKLHNVEEVTGTRDINLRNVSVSVGNRELLENAELQLIYGHRYGLIGRNGVGKTTLLRNFVERELEGIPPYLQILHIEQEVAGDETTALDMVLKTDVERARLLQEEKELLEGDDDSGGERLARVYERMDAIDAHSAESRAAAILSGLQFTPEMQYMKTKQFSGGWRMRISLARALFVEPDVLLLDEPTNHLDLHAVLWLENYLQKWKKTVVVVSHARRFLNDVVTDIIHFQDKQLHYYRGDYDTFEHTRIESLKLQQKTHEAQQKQREHVQQFIDRFRYKAATAKMVQSRIKMLEKMEFVAAVAEDPEFSFVIPSPDALQPPYLQAIDVTFGYSSERILFSRLNFNLDMDSRIALVGPNGAGKSTFLNVLTGSLRPLEGIVNVNRKIRIARFSQHHVDQLNLQQTPLEYMTSKYPQTDSQQLRSHLGGLGLSGDLGVQPIYTLSGGQKSRVAFAELTFLKPHLLLLDEPTNHLDIDTVDALIQALNSYQGGVLMVSHDEHLIESCCDELWVCSGGEINKSNVTFAEYKKEILKEIVH
jgi:ATP-binding cassette subfamily F protein 3